MNSSDSNINSKLPMLIAMINKWAFPVYGTKLRNNLPI